MKTTVLMLLRVPSHELGLDACVLPGGCNVCINLGCQLRVELGQFLQKDIRVFYIIMYSFSLFLLAENLSPGQTESQVITSQEKPSFAYRVAMGGQMELQVDTSCKKDTSVQPCARANPSETILILRSTCVGWPNGEKLAPTCVRIELDQSHCKLSQAHARRLWPN